MDNQQRIIRIVAEQNGFLESDITPEKDLFGDLAFDSLDFVETIMAVEDEFEREIPDVVAEKFRTVQDIINHVNAAA